jgi:hypothetical protein
MAEVRLHPRSSAEISLRLITGKLCGNYREILAGKNSDRDQ